MPQDKRTFDDLIAARDAMHTAAQAHDLTNGQFLYIVAMLATDAVDDIRGPDTEHWECASFQALRAAAWSALQDIAADVLLEDGATPPADPPVMFHGRPSRKAH